MRRHALATLALVASGALLPMPDAAAQSSLMKDSDFALLPAACKTRLRGQPSEWKPLVQLLGQDTFEDLHHHCFGMWYQNLAKMTVDRRKKAEYLKESIGQFDYVLRHYPADTPLRAEAESLKRQSELLLQLAK